jgi:acetolactate synthase-1/2/3 large subunit
VTDTTTQKRGADHLVDGLAALGIDTVYSLSGNQIMPVYDALIGSGLRLVHTRHEAAAVHMAEADAQLTNRVGVALLTAGPGFANGLSAIFTAQQSQTPVLVLTGDAPLARDGHGAFQEMDQLTAAGAFAKASIKLARAEDAFDLIRDAAAFARGGTPGPVHISLPDDVLRKTTGRDGARRNPALARTEPASTGPVARIAERIRAAKRPLIVAGPAFARQAHEAALASHAATSNIPIIALESPRGLRAPRIGALTEVLPEADLIVTLSLTPNFLLGFGEAPAVSETAHFICCADDPEALARAGLRLGEDRIDVVTLSGARALAAWTDGPDALLNRKSSGAEAGWRDKVEAAVAWRPSTWAEIEAGAPPFHAAAIAHALAPFLTDNPSTTLTIDGGEVGQWSQAILDAEFALINGPSGAIGGSIPYAIAAKTARPDAPSLAILGDGTAGFHFMEYETAIREHLPFVAIIGNDAKWNAEYQIQVRDYGENRTFGCEMAPTRYDEIVRAMGGYGEHVTDLVELRPAIERAIASGLPACIDVPLESNPAPQIRRI